MGPAERGIFVDRDVSPEVVWGKEFRMPSIIGRGTGRDFGFDGLCLPKGWETTTDQYKSQGYWRRFYRLLEFTCETHHLIPGDLQVDSTTGVLTRMSVYNGRSEQAVSLAHMRHAREEGRYEAENVTDAKSAIALQAGVARFLTSMGDALDHEQEYAYIDKGEKGGYFSIGLTLPEAVHARSYELVTHSGYQADFALRASNIAGRFGTVIKQLQYNDRGVLNFVGLREGSACHYMLERSAGGIMYVPHNVDTPEQALTLHGVIAQFINDVSYKVS